MKSKIKNLLCVMLMAKTTMCVASYSYSDPVINAPAIYDMPVIQKTGVYLKGFGGANLLHNPNWHHTKYRTNTGYVIGGTVGLNFSPLSIEGEFSYRNNTINHLRIDAFNVDMKGTIEQWCGFGNVLLKLPLSQSLVPYAGAGAGYRHTKPGVNFDESSDLSFENFIKTANEWGVYQVIGGFNLALSPSVGMQLEYRYVDGCSATHCSNHTIALGASILF
jgi:opacity protein-like surface antigen